MYFTNYYQPPQGGVHKVSRDVLIIAQRKSKYRDRMAYEVNERLKSNFVERGWWIFKWKRSQLGVVCDHIGNHYSAVWDTAEALGFISEHERDVLKQQALSYKEVSAMLGGSESFLSTLEMKKLMNTLEIKERK